MYRSRSIAVVVPCHNEEKQVGTVLATLPDIVDAVVVIDDASRDGSRKEVEQCRRFDPRITLLRHSENRGVGAAIATGYQWALEKGISIAVVMAGDGQMSPADLPAILDPVARGEADYCKGDRFSWPGGMQQIPKLRLAGNMILTLLTRRITGYPHLNDTQNGYTAISKKALQSIDWSRMYPRYGQPNDLLITLSLHGFRVAQVPNRPLYHPGKISGMNLAVLPFSIGLLLLKGWLRKRRAR